MVFLFVKFLGLFSQKYYVCEVASNNKTGKWTKLVPNKSFFTVKLLYPELVKMRGL